MEITRLRICTFKSKADFYYGSNWTVRTLFDDKPNAILKAYYELEKISFSKEVIDEIKLKYPRFFEIDKPGKFIGNWKQIIFNNFYPDWSEKSYQELLTSMRYYSINKKKIPDELRACFLYAKSKVKRSKDNEIITISKRSLQGKNQGH
jgi:hypothetical protein